VHDHAHAMQYSDALPISAYKEIYFIGTSLANSVLQAYEAATSKTFIN
jgi:hypothetical protein